MSFMTLSCAAQHKTKDVRIPIIKYHPATYLSDIESALSRPTSFECLSADSQQLAVLGRSLIHPPEPPCGKEFTQMLEAERIGHPALTAPQYVHVFIHRLKLCKKRIE